MDGRPVLGTASGRFRRRVQELFVTSAEREEADLERRIRAYRGVTRPNTIALISPKGGVGKTTSTFVVGNLLATHLKLRAIAVDANPDFGTLARLAPDDRRAERSLADLLDDAERCARRRSSVPYVSRLSTGLHVLGAPADAALTASLGPERYGELAAFLSTFYDVVLLDLGTGVAGPLARFAIERADQVVLVTTPEWVTSIGRARRALAPAARAHDRGDQPVAPGLDGRDGDRGPVPGRTPASRGDDSAGRSARGDARQRDVRARRAQGRTPGSRSSASGSR